MWITNFLQRHLWLPFTLALVLGIAAPWAAASETPILVMLLMVAFFFACLKTDALEVISHIKQPAFVAGTLAMLMLAIPALLYFAMSFINDDLALGVLLLSAMPPGTAAPAITDLLGGRTSLSLALCIVSFVVSPITVVLLIGTLTTNEVHLDLPELFATLLLVNLLPLALAQVVKRVVPDLVERTKDNYGVIGVLCISVIIYLATSVEAANIVNNPWRVLTNVAWLYGVFAVLQLAGYIMGFRREKQDRIALAVSSGYMNNALAIGLAAAFFSPQIAFIAVISEIPWSTTVGPLQLALRRLP